MTNVDTENVISYIKKRSGTLVLFNREKISNAIFSALGSTSLEDKELSRELSKKVVQKLIEKGFQHSKAPTVEDIQDIVQLILIENNHSNVARDYINYRLERRFFRESSILKEPVLTTNHKKILQILYPLLDGNGTFTCFNKPKKEFYELEKLGYLSIDRNYNIFGLNINLKNLDQLNQFLNPKNVLSS